MQRDRGTERAGDKEKKARESVQAPGFEPHTECMGELDPYQEGYIKPRDRWQN